MVKVNKYLILMQLLLLNLFCQSLIQSAAKIQIEQESTELDLEFLRAAKNGNIKKVEELIKQGPNVNAAHQFGKTALMWASINRHKEIVELLINRGVDVNAAGECGWTALIYAAFDRRGLIKEVVELLIKHGANVNATTDLGDTALIWASVNRHKEIVELLIKANANVEAVDQRGNTALMAAAKFGNKEIVELLLKAGADIECKNKDNKNAMHYAEFGLVSILDREAPKKGNQEIVKILEDEPQRRENKIIEWQKIISNKISNLVDKPLINDVIPLISQYTIGKYKDVLEFEKSNPNIIEMLLKANETLNSNNKLKRKADAENTDERDLVDKKTKLSQSAILSLINELKEKRENIHKEIAALGMNIDNMGLIEAKEEEIVNINQKIDSLEKQLNEI